MNIKDISEKAKEELTALTGFASPKAVAVAREGKDWRVKVEVVEKESIPSGMDVLGIYAVRLSADGVLLGYEREAMRKRTDTAEVGGGGE